MSLALTQLIGFGGARRSTAPSVAFVAATASSSDLTTYTFSSHAIGTASATRYIVVGVSVRASTTSALTSSVTVGGNSATKIKELNNTTNNCCSASLHIIAVASGTTADIVVTHSRSAIATGIGVWAVYDVSSATPTDSASTTSDSSGNLNCDTTIGDVIIGCAVSAGTPTTTWTGATEDYDQAMDAYVMHGASAVADATASPRTITCDWVGTSTAPVAVAVVLR